jgi:hypothetical protein
MKDLELDLQIRVLAGQSKEVEKSWRVKQMKEK